MNKTLYLFDQKECIIKVDGASILVTKKTKAPYRIPFGHVDFVYVNYKQPILKNVLDNLIQIKKPLILTNPNTRDSIHIIPEHDSGYFFEISQRLAIKNTETRKRIHMLLQQVNKEVQLAALSAIDKNLGKAYKNKFLSIDNYRYYIQKPVNNNLKKFYIVKKNIRQLFFGLTNSKCLQHGFNINEGIINENKKMAFTHDICSVIDPISDVLAVKFFDYKQQKLWINNHNLSDSGLKIVAILFEKSKDVTSKLLDRILRLVAKNLQNVG